MIIFSLSSHWAFTGKRYWFTKDKCKHFSDYCEYIGRTELNLREDTVFMTLCILSSSTKRNRGEEFEPGGFADCL